MPPLRELNMTTAGPLRSTGVTPLPRYYGPLRLPTNPHTRLWIPLLPPGYEPQPVGPLRFLDLSFATRRPLSPRWAAPLHLLIASQDVLASSIPKDWPPITCVSRLNPVQPYGLRLTASLSSGPPLSPALPHQPASLPMLCYLHTTGRSYMYNQQFTRQPPLRLLERSGLS